MNLYSNILLAQLPQEEKYQSKGVNKFLKEHMFPRSKPKKIFHIGKLYLFHKNLIMTRLPLLKEESLLL